ncbi:MAG: hypothetical protein DWP97_08750 [Calditrichaeota bacterium]|nr:MAG: hypothetical protein DWP97_08750 [Calditrichota bacterium]
MIKILKIALQAVAIVCMSSLTGYAQFGYTIDHVDGAYGNDVKPGQPITMHLRLQNYSSERLACITTGFRFYLSNNGELPDGEFQVINYDESLVNWLLKFDLIYAINTYSFDGIGADTLGIGGVYLTWNDDRGFDIGYDDVVMTFTTQVDASFAGDSLCIDSSYYPPTGIWLWQMKETGLTPPDWSGPHCYEILPSCCINYAGNYDNSDDDQINVYDLEFMKNYMFEMGPYPPCFDEADPNSDTMHDISDLVYMVEYMFSGGPQPLDCP